MRTTSTLILAGPILAASMGAAFPHSYPRSAIPPVNSTVTLPPREVTIILSEAVEPRFSAIEVSDSDARRVDDGKPHATSGDGTRLSVGLRTLPPGTYIVAWHATSVDTYQTAGSYRFTVAAAGVPGIGLEHVWARPIAGSAATAAVYFTVTNKSQPDRLTGVSTPIAAGAELHETINDNGVMKMRPVQSIALDPGKPVTFKPGGYHVMLTGMKGALKAGDSFPLTLTFEHAQLITETVKVDAAGSAAAMGAHGGMDGMPGMQGH
jgi:copper(I)-binding protein